MMVSRFQCTSRSYSLENCLFRSFAYFVGVCFCVSNSMDLLFCLTCPGLSVSLCASVYFHPSPCCICVFMRISVCLSLCLSWSACMVVSEPMCPQDRTHIHSHTSKETKLFRDWVGEKKPWPGVTRALGAGKDNTSHLKV